MKYHAIINFDIAESQLMLHKDVYDMQVVFKGKLQNSIIAYIPFLLKIYFAEGSLSKRAQGSPPAGVHGPVQSTPPWTYVGPWDQQHLERSDGVSHFDIRL